MIPLRLGIAMLGVALCVAGVALDDKRIVWVAIGMMVVALLLRFRKRSL